MNGYMEVPEETVRSWVQSLPEKKEVVKEELLLQLCEMLQLSKDGRDRNGRSDRNSGIPSGGKCRPLPARPWLSRLFAILDYLDDERKSLRNTALKNPRRIPTSIYRLRRGTGIPRNRTGLQSATCRIAPTYTDPETAASYQ